MISRFVIITMQRSGSTMLRSMLDNHPEISCFGELFKDITDPLYKRIYWNIHSLLIRNRSYGHKSWNIRNFLSDISNARFLSRKGKHKKLLRLLDQLDPAYKNAKIRFSNPDDYIDAVFSTEPTKQIIGFKLHIEQYPDFLERIISESNYKIILLERENILAQYSSWLIAKTTGQHHVKTGSHAPRVKVKFRPRSFQHYKARIENDYSQIKSLLNKNNRENFYIRYTELTDVNKIDDLIKYLGASVSNDIHPDTRKWNTSEILDRFVNPVDARKTLIQMDRPEWAIEEMYSG